VVQYWSSHLKSAKSKKIVPGLHDACELPETIDELRRLLHTHLKSNAKPGTTVRQPSQIKLITY